MKLKQLLAATDLSVLSGLAVDRGFLLARQCKADYHVMHALNLPALQPVFSLLDRTVDTLGTELEKKLGTVLRQLVADKATQFGYPAQCHLARERAAPAICQHANQIDADLILLGAHGRGFFEQMFLGSTAARVVRTSRQPVLVIRTAPASDYQRVLVAVDFSPVSAAALTFIRALAPTAELVLLHSFDVLFDGKLAYAGVADAVIQQYRVEARDRALQQLRQLAQSAGLPELAYQLVVSHEDPARAILQQQQQQDCDLIVVGKHGVSALEKLFIGSATEHVLASAPCDVLVVNPPASERD